MERVEFAVVGAGRAALSALAALPRETIKDCVVIDPAGTWLHAFASRHVRNGATHLRSTVTQTPFPGACGLQTYIEETGQGRETVKLNEAYAAIPSVKVYAEYCALSVSRLFGNARVIKGAVVDVDFVSAESDDVKKAMRDGGFDLGRFGAMILTLDDGRRVLAARCVWTAKFSVPLVPEWVLHARESYATRRVEEGQDVMDCSNEILNARDVDVSVPKTTLGKRILVVGGGMTAATLAISACRRGAKSVTLLSRRRLTVSEFECDVKYFGNKGLRDFQACGDMQRRAEMLETFATHATVNEFTHQQLLKEQNGKLLILEQRMITSVTWNHSKKCWQLVTVPSEAATVEFESEQYRRFREGGVKPEESAFSNFQKESLYDFDTIWLGCGEVTNVANDPALQSLILATEIQICKGLPTLAEETFDCEHNQGLSAVAGGAGGCRWPGTSLYIIGAYASLTIGPGADLAVGQRITAKQIATTMKRHQSMILRKIDPYAVKKHTADECSTPHSHEVRTNGGPPKLPIEMRAKGIIDIAQIVPQGMKLVELEQYDMYEEDMTMDIRVKLPEQIASENICVCFERQALEMWAIGRSCAYRFFVQKLYKPVIVDRCNHRVFAKKQRVTLKIHKYNNLYWRFLKG